MFGTPVEIPVLVVMPEIPGSVGIDEPPTAPTGERLTVGHPLGVLSPETLVELPIAVGDRPTGHETPP